MAEKPLTLCIGGGPAGLTAAYELSSHQAEVMVLEADPVYLGGISRTVQRDGFGFDIGGHRFFSKSAEIVKLWKEILGPDLLMRQRRSRIYYGGKFYPYPLDIQKTLSNLGIVQSGLCGLSYLKAKLFPVKNPRSFEDWVTNQFGARLYRIFFKTYTEKVWGIPCSQISADWASQRIKGLSFGVALRHALKKPAGNRVKSLTGEFLYPRKGPGMMWQAAGDKIRMRGGRVQLGCHVNGLALHAATGLWTVRYVKDGMQLEIIAHHIISSMPLSELIHALPHVPQDVRDASQSLHYRDFIIVALVMKDVANLPDNWIYIHDPGVKVGRVQNFKAWSLDMVPDSALTCLGFEYFCFEHDNLWDSSDEELIALATRELGVIGLADSATVIKGYVVRQKKAYPVYDHSYQQHVNTIRGYLREHCPGLQVAGRNGMHKYNNQDHSMMTALLAARNILAGNTQFDVWQVNQDAEYHETSERLVPMPLP